MVTHYGGPNGTTTGNIIDRTQRAVFTTENGVGVRRYGGPEGDPANFPSSLLDDNQSTADNTEQTATNVSRLDQNNQRGLRDLGTGIESSLSTVNHTVSNLGDLIGNEFGQLPSYLTAALSQNGSAISSGQGPEHLFGPNYDLQHGSYTMIQTARPVGSYHLADDNGSHDTQVSVAQPGSNITLNYYAAQGESASTAAQRARELYRELATQEARS
jgi:hypothetical protein